MNKDFIPYEQALELKELRYDIPSISCYSYPDSDKLLTQAPLYQQAFRWFREKHGCVGEIFSQLRPSSKSTYGFKIGGSDTIFDGFNTYEESELACLNKLIEITKTNNL
jgi:hypothetical protein